MADTKKLEEAENINIEQPNTYADQLEAAVANVGKPYQYDWNTDQLYQDYKKGYMTEAQKAKNNVIKAGKTLTGGYPDTYVDSVAQQQYSNYMTEINRLAPAFENLAYSQQMMENQDALKQAAMLADLSNTEYARYRDLVGDAQNNRKYEFNNYKYDTGREMDEKKVADALERANREYEQQLYLDRIKEAEAAQAAARASRGGGGGGWGGYGGYDDYGGIDTSSVYNAHGDASAGGLDWVQVPGAGRLSGTEVQYAMQAGWIGYWTDANGKDHYTLTDAGRAHYSGRPDQKKNNVGSGASVVVNAAKNALKK